MKRTWCVQMRRHIKVQCKFGPVTEFGNSDSALKTMHMNIQLGSQNVNVKFLLILSSEYLISVSCLHTPKI
jgi:hypothetical protein